MSFRNIIGHKRQCEILQSAIRRGKVHHAYLFVGIPGVGRRTMALAFCQALNCEIGDGDACNECLPCRKMLGRSHPDVLIVGDDPTVQEIRVADIRKGILRFVSFKVYEGRYRVIVLLDAERMNNHAANALLKTLEEPPPRTTFILTTAKLSSLLPTIRSRCQKLQLPPVDESELAEFLVEKKNVSLETARLLARISAGSPGVAMGLTDEQLSLREELANLLSELVSETPLAPLELTEQILSTKDAKSALMTRLDVLATLLRDAVVLQQAPGLRLRNPDIAEALMTVAERISFSSLDALLNLIWELKGAMKLHINPQVILERLLIELSRIQRMHYDAPRRRETGLGRKVPGPATVH